jgi:hypothetical protein
VFADVIALMHAHACMLSNGVLFERHLIYHRLGRARTEERVDLLGRDAPDVAAVGARAAAGVAARRARGLAARLHLA